MTEKLLNATSSAYKGDSMHEALAQLETDNYKYQLNRSMMRELNCKRDKIDEVREQARDLKYKEAMTSDLLVGWIPTLFLDTIMLGLYRNTARELFRVVPQTENFEFKVRYRYFDEKPQVTAAELAEVKALQSERETTTFDFLKIMSANFMSEELIQDSVLDEITAELTMQSNRIARTEWQLMCHRLIEYSSGTLADKWTNYVAGPDSSGTGDELYTAMRSAYLNMTTRIRERIPANRLMWLMSPSTYADLFGINRFGEYRLSGLMSNDVTGKINVNDSILNIPIRVEEMGYFDEDSNWMPLENEVFLIDTSGFAIRERWPMRTSELDARKNLARSFMMYERLMPYVLRPDYMTRISPVDDYSTMITRLSNLNVVPGTDSPTVFNN